MKSFLTFFLTVTSTFIYSQTCSTEAITTLDQAIKETSGLIFFDGRLVTHNDSGDDANLYEIDTVTGGIQRTVSVTNAVNVDWEDIAQDENYIYVGDFGNNNGNRGDLTIYVVSKTDFKTQTNVTADTILIQYADQIDFSSQPNANNYDCEAMIAFGDSLMLFSKNWENEKTYLYTLPKVSGTYSLVKRDSFDTQGTITGATYNSLSNEILLTGYKTSNLSKYLWKLSQFNGYNVLAGTNTRCDLNITGSIQVEAIAMKNQSEYFLSSEEVTRFGITLDSYLSTYETAVNTAVNDVKKFRIELFPNPVNNFLIIVVRNISQALNRKIKITNTLGEILYENENILKYENKVDTSNFPSGIYYLSIIDDDVILTRTFIKN